MKYQFQQALVPRGAQQRRTRAGFTLAELLIAIGILGVCLSLGASLFPLAVKEHAKSVGNTIGTLICRNGVNIAKIMLKDSAGGTNVQRVDESVTRFAYYYPSLLTARPEASSPGEENFEWMMHPDWPAPDSYVPRSLQGCVLFRRRIVANENDYQLIAVAFTKRAVENRVTADSCLVAASGIVDGNTTVTSTNNGRLFHAGGVMIVVETGEYAMIDRVGDGDDGPAMLDGLLNVAPGEHVYVVHEIDASTNDLIPRNPVIAVMSTRTSLSLP